MVLSSAATILDVRVSATVPLCTSIDVPRRVNESAISRDIFVETLPPTFVKLLLVRLSAITVTELFCVPIVEVPTIVAMPETVSV